MVDMINVTLFLRYLDKEIASYTKADNDEVVTMLVDLKGEFIELFTDYTEADLE